MPATDILNQHQGDRLAFTFFLALALHSLLVLGVTFTQPDPAETLPSLSVTLVTHRSEQPPEQTDYLAQSHQQASGTLQERQLPTTTEVTRFSDSGMIRTQQEQRQAGSALSRMQLLAGRSDSRVATAERPGQAGQHDSNQEAQLDAQSLLAQLDLLRQEYARMPRVGVLTSVAARATDEAAYQMMLQERIQDTGNRHYPQAALQQRLFGEVRLKLEIMADGRLESAEILESSGYLVLDRAAVDIARMSGPFPPFPDNLRSRYDRIVFIRSWQFLPGGTLQAD